MRSQIISYGFGVLLAASCSPSALAQDAGTSGGPSGAFGISGEATLFEFDVVNGFASTIDDSTFLFIRQSDDGADFNDWGGGGNLHLVVPFTDTMFGFDGFQLTAGGSLASGEASGSQTLGPLEFYDVLPINGDASPGFIASGVDLDPTVDQRVDIEFSRAFGMPALRGSFGGGMISFNVGPLVEFKQVELDIAQTPASTAFFNNLSEDIDIWSAGPTAALSFRMPLWNGFEWFGGGRGAVLWSSGELDAHQEYDVAGAPVSLDVSDEETVIATLLRITTGISMTAGSLTAEVYGAAEWRDDMYKIVNPESGSGIDSDVATFDAAHLEQSDMVAYSVGIRGAIKFGGM